MTANVCISFDGTLEDVKAAMAEFLGNESPAKLGAPATPPATSIPAVESAPATPAAAVGTGAQEGLELDSDGYPWDARINTSNKTQTAKGVWKRKPGITNDVYKQVRIELKANVTGPATQEHVDNVEAAKQTPPAVPPAPQAMPDPMAAQVTTPPPGVESYQQAPPTPAAPGTGGAMTWTDIMREITVRAIDPVTVQTACGACGVADMTALQNAPHLIPSVAAQLGIFPQ